MTSRLFPVLLAGLVISASPSIGCKLERRSQPQASEPQPALEGGQGSQDDGAQAGEQAAEDGSQVDPDDDSGDLPTESAADSAALPGSDPVETPLIEPDGATAPGPAEQAARDDRERPRPSPRDRDPDRVALADPGAAPPEPPDSIDDRRSRSDRTPQPRDSRGDGSNRVRPRGVSHEQLAEVEAAFESNQELFDGVWVGGGPDELALRVDINGTMVSASGFTDAKGEGSTLFEFLNRDATHFTFRAAGAGEVVLVHALFVSPDEAMVWMVGDEELSRLRRIGILPEELVGEWTMEEGGGLGERLHLTIREREIQLDGSAETLDAFPLARIGPTIDVAMLSDDRGGYMVHFHPLGADAFLSWEDGRATYQILYRRGERPRWLEREVAELRHQLGLGPEEPTGGSAEPPSTSATTSARPDDSEEAAGPIAAANLRRIAESASTYFAAYRRLPDSTDWTPDFMVCRSPTIDPDAWSGTWSALGFVIQGPTRFQYRFVSGQTAAQEPQFAVEARTDRDCDGIYHLLSVEGRLAVGGNLVYSTVGHTNEGE